MMLSVSIYVSAVKYMIIKYDTNDDPAVPALFINGMILITVFRHKARDESCLSDEREKKYYVEKRGC